MSALQVGLLAAAVAASVTICSTKPGLAREHFPDTSHKRIFSPASLSVESNGTWTGMSEQVAQDPALDARVSVSFHGSSFDDVLRWLNSLGISFGADSNSAKPEAKLTMKIENQSLRDVLAAVAEIFGGTWETQGSIYIFKPLRPDEDPLGNTSQQRDRGSVPLGDNERRRIDELNARLRDWAERLARGETELVFPLNEFFKDNGELNWDWLGSSESIRKFLENWTEKRELREIPSGQLFVWPKMGDGKLFERKELDPKQRELIERFLSDNWPKLLPDIKDSDRFGSFPQIRFGGNLNQLFESITPEQWSTHDAKGYLAISDLTDAQRGLIGIQGGKSVSISISMAGRTLHIRSE
jgi:hypothetical protein